MIDETLSSALAEPEQSGDASNEPSEQEKALVSEIADRCQKGRKFWEPIYELIDKEIAFNAGQQWPGQKAYCDNEKYVANIVRRLVNQKVASTYARNPRSVSRIRPKLDFVVWDGEQDSLQAAREITTAFQDPTTVPDEKVAGALVKAHAILADYQNGMTRRQVLKRWGDTLEKVYDHQCDQQQPGFKQQMKGLVRRALTARVGWVKIGYRSNGETIAAESATNVNTPELVRGIAQQLNEILEQDVPDVDARKQKVELMLKSLQEGAAKGSEKLVDEGLVFDFPKTRSIIVDPCCTNLDGFVGAEWIAQEFKISADEVERRYGVDVKGSCKVYGKDSPDGERKQHNENEWGKDSKCCVWEVYDKCAQLKYVVCDGYPAFLEEPKKPDPCLSRFWPIFALCFNKIEAEENDPENDVTIYAPSDVRLLWHAQMERNRSREALRDKRIQNRDLFAATPALTEKDRKLLASGYASGTVVTLEGIPQGQKVDDVLQVVKKPPIDPAVFATGHIDEDIALVVGFQAANLGTTTGVTATETSVAEGSRIQSGSSDVDDLDDLLTDLYRAGGEMLLQKMDPRQVKMIAGPGAAWPTTPDEVYNSELWLEAEASGSGRPNKSLEISNLTQLGPLIMQIPGIKAEAFAREVIKRFDDRLDLEELFQKDLPSIMAMNSGPSPTQAAASMVSPGVAGAQSTQPGLTPPTANDPAVAAQQSPTTAQMPTQFQNRTAAAAAQPQAL